MEEGNQQALYRRHRSMSFDELVGQEHITELLKAAVTNGTFSHAYLFTGQRGTGKTSAARILAHAINDLPYNSTTNHLDIIEIDAASNRRIDDIRDLREKVFIAPVSAKYKVYIIDEVHMLTGESFNALLKTIEEPPAHAVFILATTELHKVPATIVSRTQRFHFRPVSTEKVAEHLATIATKEKIDIDKEALQLIAEHGGGSFRDSISLLDQVGGLEKHIDAALVESILGRARSTEIEQLISSLEKSDQISVHTQLRAMTANGTSPVTLAEQLVATLLLHPKPGKSWYELTEKLLSISKTHFPQLSLANILLGFTATEDIKSSRATTPEHHSKHADNNMHPKPKTPINPSTQEPVVKEAPEHVKKERAQEERIDVQPEAAMTGEFDWDVILAAVKKTNPALFAVLSRAQSAFRDNTLTLSFQYALHRKKLEQAQYRTQLSRAIQDVLGINPSVVIDGATPQLAHDDATQRVADLMGGGESITV